ncbi:hypothetical protein LINPERPRIM_LOCUS29679 [Linum perenne]
MRISRLLQKLLHFRVSVKVMRAFILKGLRLMTFGKKDVIIVGSFWVVILITVHHI